MKILLLSKYSRTGASSRLRMLQYIPYLERDGWNIVVANLLDDQYLLRLYSGQKTTITDYLGYYWKRFIWVLRAKQFDIVWVEKEIFPYFPAWAEKILKICGCKVIVDYDDAIFHNYDLSNNRWIKLFLKNKIATVMNSSSYVVAGNAYLAKYADEAGARRITVIPTVVDAKRYSLRNKEVASKKLVIGWMGSPSTQKYVADIKDALISVCNEYDAKLLLVGADKNIITVFSDIDCEVLEWNESTEAEMIQHMDVGIMPLVDGPWENGKCGYKLIQYMACGVPVIASPVGVNIKIVNESKCGFLAESVQHWESFLRQMFSSIDLRETLGNNGRKQVEELYSVQIQGPIMAHLMHKIVN